MRKLLIIILFFPSLLFADHISLQPDNINEWQSAINDFEADWIIKGNIKCKYLSFDEAFPGRSAYLSIEQLSVIHSEWTPYNAIWVDNGIIHIVSEHTLEELKQAVNDDTMTDIAIGPFGVAGFFGWVLEKLCNEDSHLYAECISCADDNYLDCRTACDARVFDICYDWDKCRSCCNTMYFDELLRCSTYCLCFSWGYTNNCLEYAWAEEMCGQWQGGGGD